ncbi:GNAT family N-acetyltransferase [Pseudonocardia kujensis]|uniref:GNAT family N-acetyltransferase n=1 Tax=Pseudonocardia kujensis TaxID=1128675 RepID=UPI001E5BAF8E|nr:GNAT family N-acetyltransferase [Pseudonocardia kujensis]MCE0765375.1 GNAT family N-acetyltransferase [Pseudonocardia kujensis]
MRTPTPFAPARHLDPLLSVEGAGDRYHCPDLTSLDAHLARLRRRIDRDGGRNPAVVATWRADLDRLLDRRAWLTLPVLDERASPAVTAPSARSRTAGHAGPAIDPRHHRAGVGRALTEHAATRLRERGSTVAMVETGGDPGHPPARGLYERGGDTPLPCVRYFRTL